MKSKLISAALLGASLVWWLIGDRAAGQENDPVASARKVTEELNSADKAVAAAGAALQRAKENLDGNRFNSAAYNARVSAEEEAAAKDKYEKSDANGKQDALEVYELAQELAAQRKAALAAAEQALPQREAEAKAAEEKFAVAWAAAEGVAGQITALVRQTENDLATGRRRAKQATEDAALAKATAESQTAANAGILKTFAELSAADKAVQQAAAAAKQASDAERPKKLAEAENAIKACAAALYTAAQHLSLFDADRQKLLILELRIPLVEADRAVQAASAALQQAQRDLEGKTNAVKEAQQRIAAAQQAVETRIAKTRAAKDLAREQEAAKRAEAARVSAEQALPAATANAERARGEYAAALRAAVTSLVESAEGDAALTTQKEAIAKAITDKEAEIGRQNETLVRRAAESQTEAEKAQADLAVVEKLAAGQSTVREALQGVLRRRFYRDVGVAQDDFRRHDTALAAATKESQAKAAAVAKAAAELKQMQVAVADAQKAAAAATASVAETAQKKEAAEKSVRDTAGAKTAAEKAANDARSAAAAAEKALAESAAENKATAEKTAKELQAVAQTAAQKFTEAERGAADAQKALEETLALRQAAEKKAADASKAVEDMQRKLAEIQAASDRATAEQNAADQSASQHRAALNATRASLAVAKAAAYGGLKPLPEAAWDYAKARHLLTRAGFGGTPDEVAKLQAMGLHDAVEHLLNFRKHPPAEISFEAYPKMRLEAHISALSGEEQQLLRNKRAAEDRQQMQNMRAWWLRRMIESPTPLEEKLTLFWHGQIPTQYSDVGDSYHMYLQNQLFRENAAGNFATLLHGTVHDAAMLKYLNNDTNVKGRANENLARELMELFSMGRDQGYTEIDIRQGARALTGYTYDAATGQFRFVSERHDSDPKSVFGKTGNWSGDDFARLILETPYPAKFVARQLFAYFAHDEPSADVVEALANVLRVNSYEIAPLLENLFLSEEFYSARSMGTDIKSPVQLVVGLHRELGLKAPDYAYLVSALRETGQDLFEPPSVFGWQAGRSWITTSRVLERYNTLAEILEERPRNGQSGVDVCGTLLAGKTFQSHAEVIDYLVKCTWSVPLPETKRAALVDFLKPLPPPDQWGANPGPVNASLTRVLVMLTCSPEYQLN
ncbi:MAG: hypothetical protein DCC68_17515 [Planctomycetota bacterium]|nr:MAG: hypothetical protein DCC68_17515 [Planctomycetota bacterium]